MNAFARAEAHLVRSLPAADTHSGTSKPGRGVSRSTSTFEPVAVNALSVAASPSRVAVRLAIAVSCLPPSTTVLPNDPDTTTSLGFSETSLAIAAVRHVLHSVYARL